MKKRIPEFQISLVKFLDGKDDTLFTHSSLSFQEWAGIERRGRGNSKVSKLVSKWMPRVIHTHIYIYPPPPLHWTACFENAAFQPTVTRILRAGIRGCRKFFRLLAREFLAQSCQAAVLMKRYRRNRGFEQVSLKISQHLAFQIRDVRRYRIQQVSESAGKVFFEFG